MQAQAKAEKDPLGFVEALKNGVRSFEYAEVVSSVTTFNINTNLFSRCQLCDCGHLCQGSYLAFLPLFHQSLEPLPGRQQVAELPEIDWKGYVDSLQLVARQQSSIYLHTRKHSGKHVLDAKSVRKWLPVLVQALDIHVD